MNGGWKLAVKIERVGITRLGYREPDKIEIWAAQPARRRFETANQTSQTGKRTSQQTRGAHEGNATGLVLALRHATFAAGITTPRSNHRRLSLFVDHEPHPPSPPPPPPFVFLYLWWSFFISRTRPADFIQLKKYRGKMAAVSNRKNSGHFSYRLGILQGNQRGIWFLSIIARNRGDLASPFFSNTKNQPRGPSWSTFQTPIQ